MKMCSSCECCSTNEAGRCMFGGTPGPCHYSPSQEVRVLRQIRDVRREPTLHEKAAELLVEDVETLLRIIGKRGLYPSEDDWELIANCANTLRASLAALKIGKQSACASSSGASEE